MIIVSYILKKPNSRNIHIYEWNEGKSGIEMADCYHLRHPTAINQLQPLCHTHKHTHIYIHTLMYQLNCYFQKTTRKCKYQGFYHDDSDVIAMYSNVQANQGIPKQYNPKTLEGDTMSHAHTQTHALCSLVCTLLVQPC